MTRLSWYDVTPSAQARTAERLLTDLERSRRIHLHNATYRALV